MRSFKKLSFERRAYLRRSFRKIMLLSVVAVLCGLCAGSGLAIMLEWRSAPSAPVVSPAPPSPSNTAAPGGASVPPAASLPPAGSGAGSDYIVEAETTVLELPVVGATGFTLISTDLWPQPLEQGEAGSQLPPGASFAVMEERGQWWRVEGDEFSGWVLSGRCMINLPDVIPSIVYDNANAYSSVFVTCGRSIPNITGEALYAAWLPNERLGRDEFVVPLLYPMAKRIYAAQQAALAEGNTLVIIEAFRPWNTQQVVAQAVSAMAAEDATISAAVTGAPWGVGWFIASGVSNHQQGYAVDLTIARIEAAEEVQCCEYTYTRVTRSTRYEMQTPIHELSSSSAAMAGPLDPRSDKWRTMAPAPRMNQNAFTLQRYCTDAGMTPLASEWWHFNDYTALDPEIAKRATGNFMVNACHSFVP